jgi:hypothetical protein
MDEPVDPDGTSNALTCKEHDTMRIRATFSAFAFLGLFATAAQAQGTQNPVEVGIDAQISFGLDDQGTSISIPAQKVRAGFMISPVMTIEPSLGFYRISNDGSSMSSTALDVSLLYHFSAARTARQFYVRPVIGLTRLGAEFDGEGDSQTDLNIGVAGGMKLPLMDRVGARVEAEFRNYMSDPSVSALNLNFGLSYFTR